jgi:cytochrome c biogenesis protein CcdA
VLASVLSYAAYQGQVLYGALLSFLYGLGIGAPMLLVGTAAGGFAQRLDSGGWKVWVDRSVGALLLALGLYLLWRA